MNVCMCTKKTKHGNNIVCVYSEQEADLWLMVLCERYFVQACNSQGLFLALTSKLNVHFGPNESIFDFSARNVF